MIEDGESSLVLVFTGRRGNKILVLGLLDVVCLSVLKITLPLLQIPFTLDVRA